MNENLLVVLLIVIIFALIASIVTEAVILSKLNDHFNDMDYHYIYIRTKLDYLARIKEDEKWKHLDRYTSTCNRLDAIIGSLDDICNVCENISEDTHSVDPVEVAKCKDLKDEKPDDGGCSDCMFVFKNEFEEPCNKCCHAYATQFASRRNKE